MYFDIFAHPSSKSIRAPLPPQRRPKVVDQMFDSSSLFTQDLSAPENTGDGVYFSYSAIL